MQKDFWHQKWQSNDTAFNQEVVNPALVKYFPQLKVNKGSRIMVPLCGRTIDMVWLLNEGYHVVGAELSQKAVDQFFAEQKITPKIESQGTHLHYKANHLEIWVGDFFELTKERVGRIDAIYDRAAMVALPLNMRQKYAKHLIEISNKAPQLLLCYEYDQCLQEGPPFCVNHEEIRSHYGLSYQLKLLETVDIPGGLKGKCTAQEHVWLLT